MEGKKKFQGKRWSIKERKAEYADRLIRDIHYPAVAYTYASR